MIASISAGIIHSLMKVRTSSNPVCSGRSRIAPRTAATTKSARSASASARRPGVAGACASASFSAFARAAASGPLGGGDGAGAARPRSGRRGSGARFSSSFAMITAVTAAENVERKEGRTMPAGSFDPSAARTATAPSGRIATPAALMARKSAIELVATPGPRVEGVQLGHRLEPERRRGVPQPEHVRGEVEDHRPHRGVILRDLREEPAHERAQRRARWTASVRPRGRCPSSRATAPSGPPARWRARPRTWPPSSEASVTLGMVPRKDAVRTEPAMRTKKMPLSTGPPHPSSAPGRGAPLGGAGKAADGVFRVVER